MKSDLILAAPRAGNGTKQCQNSAAVSCVQRQNFSADHLAPLKRFVYLVAELKLRADYSNGKFYYWQVFWVFFGVFFSFRKAAPLRAHF